MPTKQSEAERNARIVVLRRDGATLEQIGHLVSLTPQRVGRVLKAHEETHARVRGRPCPACGGNSEIIRVQTRSDVTKRRHKCLSCQHRWSSTQRDDEPSKNEPATGSVTLR